MAKGDRTTFTQFGLHWETYQQLRGLLSHVVDRAAELHDVSIHQTALTLRMDLAAIVRGLVECERLADALPQDLPERVPPVSETYLAETHKAAMDTIQRALGDGANQEAWVPGEHWVQAAARGLKERDTLKARQKAMDEILRVAAKDAEQLVDSLNLQGQELTKLQELIERMESMREAKDASWARDHSTNICRIIRLEALLLSINDDLRNGKSAAWVQGRIEAAFAATPPPGK